MFCSRNYLVKGVEVVESSEEPSSALSSAREKEFTCRPSRCDAPMRSVEYYPMGKKEVFRVVTRGTDGSLRIRDYGSEEPLLEMHTQVGVDDCSTDLAVRGLPVFRGLIGPIPEGKNIIRYESPEVFETLTKEWVNSRTKRRSRRTAAMIAEDKAAAEAASQLAENTANA